MRSILASLASILVAGPALAQDRPPLIPTRDVSIAYRSTVVPPGVPAGATLRMSWLVAEQKLRVDMPGDVGWSLVDQRRQTMVMVLERQRIIMDLPIQGGPGGLSIPSQVPDSARFTRAGSATVAGFACTLWRYEDTNGRGEACVTADGVMLRSSGTHGGQTGTLEATEVAYGAQDPARFRIPTGYQSMQIPGQIPGVPPPKPPPGVAR